MLAGLQALMADGEVVMLNFADAFAEMPLIAIVRGVHPDEVVAVATALYDAGIRIVEVPLNSPDPFVSIERLSAMTGRMVCGAGTVLTAEQVDSAVAAGSTIIVAPNTDPSVIRQVTCPRRDTGAGDCHGDGCV